MKTVFAFILCVNFLLGCNNKKPQTNELTTSPTDTIKNNIDTTATVTSQPQDSNNIPSAKQLIIPAKSIGQIEIDEKMEEVAKLLGIPDDGDAAMGKSISIWYSKNPPKKYSTTIYSTTNFGDKDESRKVQNIRVTSPFFMTANYTRCGSDLSLIQQKYPELKTPTSHYKDSTTQTTINVYENIKDGVAFEINKANKCVGISVYKPGKRITQTYLPLFPGVEDYK